MHICKKGGGDKCPLIDYNVSLLTRGYVGEGAREYIGKEGDNTTERRGKVLSAERKNIALSV